MELNHPLSGCVFDFLDYKNQGCPVPDNFYSRCCISATPAILLRTTAIIGMPSTIAEQVILCAVIWMAEVDRYVFCM
jgi:hypothetical protein